MRAERGSLQGEAGRSTSMGSRTVTRIIGLLLVVLLAGDSAFADFLVQPMLLRRTVQPGRRITVELKLQNMDPKTDETISLTLKELSQKPDSSWIEILPTDPNLSKYPLRSCRSWISLPPDNIPVGAYKMVPFSIQIDVPAGTQGYYFAAIVAATAPRKVETATGVVTQMEFQMVVPVLLEVQSGPMPSKIALSDVGLEYRAETPDAAAASYLTVDIDNAGGTFSSLLPVIRLSGQSGGHWYKMAEMKLMETGILPGVKLHLKQDVGRPLASGAYRVEAFLYVDGKRSDRMQKELTFQGDGRVNPNSQRVADAPLEIQPVNSFIEITPGATRSSSIQVANGSEEGVDVTVELATPSHMQFMSNSHGIRGDDLSCADWVTVEPRKFSLRGYSRMNLRVIAKMPKGAAQYPVYYGALTLRATYSRDKQQAGVKETYICVQNKQVTGTPTVAAAVLTLSETGPSRYLVTGGYMNGGEMYVTPSCQGVLSLAGVGGVTNYKRFLMSSENYGQKAIMLPLEARSFTGVLDISDVPSNIYFLTSVLKWPGGSPDGLQEQRTIEVYEQGGRKYARMRTGTAQPVVIKM